MIALACARSALGMSQIRSGIRQIRSGHRECQKHMYSCSSLANDPTPGQEGAGELFPFVYSETCASPSSCVQAKEREKEPRSGVGRRDGIPR